MHGMTNPTIEVLLGAIRGMLEVGDGCITVVDILDGELLVTYQLESRVVALAMHHPLQRLGFKI